LELQYQEPVGGGDNETLSLSQAIGQNSARHHQGQEESEEGRGDHGGNEACSGPQEYQAPGLAQGALLLCAHEAPAARFAVAIGPGSKKEEIKKWLEKESMPGVSGDFLRMP